MKQTTGSEEKRINERMKRERENLRVVLSEYMELQTDFHDNWDSNLYVKDQYSSGMNGNSMGQ